ncbi:hypothetical protein [Caulobacter sp. UNC279MFTsu5.1]|uniref:hypothetical protein n=1 Tax=Caulobacter sp. UNC279MFTsu5.1 TaxID=1502775 RepID=UPI000360BAF3|nr:hypothetical protein [Caulobacter sp. UNC279MFTsu5.1]SFK42254.1 hypothetical protein SAMN02799626_04259 [Caulobacter sp. UNC279MFTsu5.1]
MSGRVEIEAKEISIVGGDEAALTVVGKVDHWVELGDIGPAQLMVLDTTGEPVEVRALLAERQYWREHQACEIGELLQALEVRAAPKAFLVQRLLSAYQGLKDAVAGEYFDRCEGCGEQIWPGEVEVPCTDVRLHASCNDEGSIKTGDKVRMPPESIEQEESEPPRDYVIAFEATNLFSAEQIQERLERARVKLAEMGRL